MMSVGNPRESLNFYLHLIVTKHSYIFFLRWCQKKPTRESELSQSFSGHRVPPLQCHWKPCEKSASQLPPSEEPRHLSPSHWHGVRRGLVQSHNFYHYLMVTRQILHGVSRGQVVSSSWVPFPLLAMAVSEKPKGKAWTPTSAQK